ncbi:MAG: Asp-tRNA(Asn)/Glu-tRNA(Gln) amidotransferase subunit GatC, partial [Spirochaetales bacterium]|nr:Asp-tRNA(Asn)/Glu-tRNA(Gln) amidotransferase subunit GatC [Spirochaetales bacterium]
SQEEKELAGQLEDILGYFEILSAIDTSGLDPDLGEALTPEQLREDTADAGVEKALIESFAVEFDEDHFVVPRILGDTTDG